MASYKTQAIIINRLNLGESDRILTLFSAGYGKVRAVVKGARRTKSKYGGHTELFSLVDFVISTGKNLDVISDATLARNFLAESPDMEKIKTVYYFAEIINRLLPDNAPNPEIYELLLYSLEHINDLDINFLQIIFVARTLKTLGIYPEMNTCIKCEEKPNRDEIYFSQSGGGILHQNCSAHFEDAVYADEATIKLWRFVADAPLAQVAKIKVTDATIKSASELANSYIHCVTMIDYKSLRVLS
jgi:DNA repair protein RecO (recombination protein O)